MIRTTPLRVVLIYRKPDAQLFSIENIFDTFLEQQTISSKLNIEFTKVELSHKLTSLRGFLLALIELKKVEGDVFHFTSEDVFVLSPFFQPSKTILHVHDIWHALNLKGLKAYLYKLFWYRIPIKRTNRVIAVSDDLKTRLTDLVGSIPSKSRTISNFVFPQFSQSNDLVAGQKKSTTDALNVLFVGTLVKKNIVPTIRYLLETNLNLILTTVGPPSSELKALHDPRIRFTGKLNLDQMVAYYREADLLCFVTRGEGFGLPIIEAQAMGVAVVCSNLPVLKEVAGNGALFVDGENPEECADGIQLLINDKEQMQSLLLSGFENSRRFPFSVFEEELLSLYQEISK